MVVGIIGAGASGMAAALAARKAGSQVILFERQARVGRKLQATGNGRCNLTNIHANANSYHGDTPAFVEIALERFHVEDTLHWFKDLGLFTVTEPSGKVYPYSDQANSVVDVLRFALEKAGVQLLSGVAVQKIRINGKGFDVMDGETVTFCDRLIIACGGLAGTKLGGSMSGYQLLRSMGHHCTRLRPALVQIKTDWNGIAGLKGVRANCHAAILHEGTEIRSSTGELQFTEYGLSGPVIFEISRDVCQGSGNWSSRLDFLPDVQDETLLTELQRRKNSELTAEELLTGILHNRLGRVLTKSAGVKGIERICDLSDDRLMSVCNAVKAFEIPLTEPMGMDSAQVTAGGIVTSEFDPATMESRLVPGLFACGEVLDIDGDCGGFNLQWAWSSGRLAGQSAGKE